MTFKNENDKYYERHNFKYFRRSKNKNMVSTKNACLEDFENFSTLTNTDTNNIRTSCSNNQDCEFSYRKLENDLNKYAKNNERLIEDNNIHDMIGDSGHFMVSNLDVNPGVDEARLQDSHDFLLLQNTGYIICSIIASSFIIAIIAIR